MQTSRNFSETCGIIGGMGPAATNYLMNLVVKLNINAKKDQDHIPLLVFNNPQIPDRNAHLVLGNESPVPELIRTGRVLKSAGATFLAIPCNTSHAYIQEIRKSLGIKVLDMIEVTYEYLKEKYGTGITIGVLATDATISAKIYQNTMKQMKVLVPKPHGQKKVMEAIYGKYGIKVSYLDNRNFKLLRNEAKNLLSLGADVIIAGCTEIPLVLDQKKCDFPIVDPMECLAKEILRISLQSKRLTKKTKIRKNI